MHGAQSPASKRHVTKAMPTKNKRILTRTINAETSFVIGDLMENLEGKSDASEESKVCEL